MKTQCSESLRQDGKLSDKVCSPARPTSCSLPGVLVANTPCVLAALGSCWVTAEIYSDKAEHKR